MKEKKTEKDLSILDSQDVEMEAAPKEESNLEGDTNMDKEALSLDENLQEESHEEPYENKKIKPWILITTFALILAIIGVGIYSWFNYTTLATYDGGRVTRAEFNKEFDATLMAQGITDDMMNDPMYMEEIEAFKDEFLITMGYDEVFYKQLENLNIAQLTKEELEAEEAESRSILEQYVSDNESVIIAGLPEGYTEKEFEEAQREFETTALNQIGCYNFADFVDLRVKNIMYERAYEALVPESDAAPTDEEVKAQFDTMLETQKSLYEETPEYYIEDLESGMIEYPLYVPNGIRMIRHVLIQIDQTKLDEIINLTSQGDQEAADKLKDEALAEIKADAEAVLEEINSGAVSFTDAIAMYGKDPGMEYYPEGYKTSQNYGGFVPEFQEAAMSLSEVGEYSGLVASTYGYHIIEYYADYEGEVLAYEDISNVIYQELLYYNREKLWQDMWIQWGDELNLEFKDEAVNALAFN